MGVPPEILRQVKLIELRTRGLVNSLFTGEYRSVFKGQGMEFAEVREYQPGDEVRIDRLERHGAHAAAVRQALHRGARADGDARGRPLGLGALRHARSASRASSRPSSPRCSRCRPSATTIASACCSSPIASSTWFRRGRADGTRCASSATCSRSSPWARAPTSPARSTTSRKMLTHKAIVFVVSDFLDGGHRASAQAAGAAPRRRRGHGRGSERARTARTSASRDSIDPETGETIDVDTSDPAVREFLFDAGRGRAGAPKASPAAARDRRGGGAHGRQASWSRCSGSSAPRNAGAPAVIVTGVGLLLLQAAVPQSVQAPPGELPVQMGYRVSPDTVLIGQPFNLFIKVHAPKGVRFEFPAGPDTTTQNGIRPIELRGERLVSMLGDTAVALYRLVAWDIGVQPLRLPDVRVTFEGQERRPPLGGASVFVRSVLPADTSLRVPKPARPLIVLPVFNWLPWLALARRGNRGGATLVGVAPLSEQAESAGRSVRARAAGICANRATASARGRPVRRLLRGDGRRGARVSRGARARSAEVGYDVGAVADDAAARRSRVGAATTARARRSREVRPRRCVAG